MTLPVILRGPARMEFDAAADWYEQQRAGLGASFAAALSGSLKQIAEQPRLYAEVLEDVREAPVPGYPYFLYYRVEPAQIVVLAVFHSSRDPTIWQSRV